MNRTFWRWFFMLALANMMVYFVWGWMNSYIIAHYQIRMIREAAHPIISAEMPRFDILNEEQWPEAVRSVHKRWNIPARLGDIDYLPAMAWENVGVYDDRTAYDMAFPRGAYAYLVLSDKQTVVEIGPLPGMGFVTSLDNLLAIVLWILFNGAALTWLLHHQNRRTEAIERATLAFLADGTARHIPDEVPDSLGQAVRSVNLMAGRAEQLIRQRQSLISEQRELLHAVSHECRAPLARVSFALEMLAHSESDVQRSQLTRDMEHAISELDLLVRELLTYARLQHGAQRLELVETSLPEMVEDVVDKTKTLYPTIAFRCDGATFIDKVLVDSRLFNRSVTNLVRNAACFARSTVSVSVEKTSERFHIHVDDDGPGVPIEQRERIFEPFTRLDPSRSRDSGGSGLGLAIVRGISERHGGTVKVSDSPIGGARFTLSWPNRSAA